MLRRILAGCLGKLLPLVFSGLIYPVRASSNSLCQASAVILWSSSNTGGTGAFLKNEVQRNEVPALFDDSVYTEADIYPKFPGSFNKFLDEHLEYPEWAKVKGITGSVYIQFIVEKDGSLGNFRIVRGIGDGCDEAAVRVMKMSPKWMPGIKDGKKVRVSYVLSISFLND